MFEKQVGGKKLEDQLEEIFKSMFECVTSPTNLKKYVSGTPEKPKLSRRKLNQVILSCFNAKKKQFDGMVRDISEKDVRTEKSIKKDGIEITLEDFILENVPEGTPDEIIKRVARVIRARRRRKRK